MTTIAEQIAAHFGSLPTLEPESVAVRYHDTETSWGNSGWSRTASLSAWQPQAFQRARRLAGSPATIRPFSGP